MLDVYRALNGHTGPQFRLVWGVSNSWGVLSRPGVEGGGDPQHGSWAG